MNAQQLKQKILEAVTRNSGRDHTPDEFAVQFAPSQQVLPRPMVEGALAELVAEGKLAQREWNGGTVVFGLLEKAAV